MKQRCLNPRSHNFKNYGERGITICKRWMLFENFLHDMGQKPDGLTLERIDNDAGYEPNNCKWADRKEQRRNQRTCRRFEFNGKTMLLREVANAIGMHETTLQQRLDYQGLSFEDAITKPLRFPKSSVINAAMADKTSWESHEV